MTIDSEGMLWIGHWNGWQVARWNPSTGEKLLQIKVPVAKVTSCTFGGEHLQDLYITTAKVDLTEAELEQQPLAGSLFVIYNCGYKGMPASEFLV
jgi:sugar lactone lactonase YvrE